MAAGETVTFDDLNLAVILNLTAYFENEAQAGLVTLILEQTNATGTNDATFYSHEGSTSLAPRLVIDATLAAVENPGDFDGDLDVDGRDFLAWQRNPSIGDLADWQTYFGTDYGASLAAASDPTAVPEPTTWALALLAMPYSLFVMRKQRR